MEDTQKYLNSILQKRLGSVPNYGGFSKNGNTVTRLPRKQQKLQSMPTVFRNKHETVYQTTGVYPGAQQSKNPLFASQKSYEQLPLKKQDSGGQNQRLQYVAISRRLDTKKQEYTAPTVDVSKYRKTNYVPPQQIPHDPNQFRSQKIPSNKNIGTFPNQSYQNHNLNSFNNIITEQNGIGREATIKPTNIEVSRMSQVSQGTQGARKRRIFGSSQQKNKQEIN